MKIGRAVLAGSVGAVVVIVVVWLGGRLAGTSADLAALTAACIAGRAGGPSWFVGLFAQLVLGACAALVYAALFERLFEHAGAWLGLAVAVPHVIVAGLIVGFLPGDRIIAAGLTPPGAFYEFGGRWCIGGFIVAHLLFGWLVGVTYRRPRHATSRASRGWLEVPRPEE
jgi:hypothetical protein